MKLKTLIALIAVAAYGLAQTPPQIANTVELMQTRGAINTALAQIATIACVGTPGNTTGRRLRRGSSISATPASPG